MISLAVLLVAIVLALVYILALAVGLYKLGKSEMPSPDSHAHVAPEYSVGRWKHYERV